MSEKIFACLLRCYPPAFRRRYQEEALQLYRDRLGDERGMVSRCRLYFDLLIDAITGLPRAWRNTYADTSAPSLTSNAEGTPSFHLLNNQPLRPASIVFGSTLSLAALSAFVVMMSLASRYPPSSTSGWSSPIESVMERLNHALPPGNEDVTTAYASAAEGASQGQLTTRIASAISIETGVAVGNTERDHVIQAAASILVAHYVDTQKAHEASDLLLIHQKRGDYDALSDGPTLAERLTQDIQGSTQDLQVAVQYSRNAIPNSPPTPSAVQHEEYRAAMMRQNCTIEKVQMLSNGIGYMKFNFFPDPTVCSEVFHRSMEQLSQSRAIIFDLRDNAGGFPGMVADVAAELFDHPVLWYNPRATPNASLLSPVPDSKLANKPVYILTSSRTFSGAEHFTYDLKMLKRATVIGEATRGGHPGAPYRVDDHFWMAVPEVRRPSPYGTLDWQGLGVEPDVKVNASDAMGTAQQLAMKSRSKWAAR